MSNKLWAKNFEVNKEIERFTVGRDREMDLYLAKYDVLGSIAHNTRELLDDTFCDGIEIKMVSGIRIVSPDDYALIFNYF